MKKEIIVTISWDDGRKRDFRFVLLLKKYNLKCTFYISPKNREWEKAELMSEDEIKKISEDFEIGAHSMTHPILTKLGEEDAYKEIYESRIYLENIIKNEENVLLFPPKDSKALAEAIITILNNPIFAKSMGGNGYKKVKENFLWDKQIEKTKKIIEESLGKK